MIRRKLLPSRRKDIDNLFAPFEQHFNELANSFFSEFTSNSIRSSSNYYPKMDGVETDGKFHLKFAVPGVKSEDLQVDIKDGVVTLSGEMSKEFKSEDEHRVWRELKQSSFRRHVILPDYVEGDPNALLKDGMLTLTWEIKKEEPVEEVKRIKIKSE